jgi:hypothetical protein
MLPSLHSPLTSNYIKFHPLLHPMKLLIKCLMEMDHKEQQNFFHKNKTITYIKAARN